MPTSRASRAERHDCDVSPSPKRLSEFYRFLLRKYTEATALKAMSYVEHFFSKPEAERLRLLMQNGMTARQRRWALRRWLEFVEQRDGDDADARRS